MRISPINNVYQNYNSSFKAKPNQSMISKVANKALLPAAICAYVLSPLMGVQAKPKKEPEKVQYRKEFVMDGKNYTMSFVNSSKYFGENAVSEIYFTPKGNKAIPLKLERMTKFVSGDDYAISLTVSEPNLVTYEIEPPKEIGDELLNLYEGNTEFFLIDGSNTYSEVYTDFLE